MSALVWFPVAVSSELSDEASVCVERGEFLERPTDFCIFKKDFVPWNVLLLSSQITQLKDNWEFVFNPLYQ